MAARFRSPASCVRFPAKGAMMERLGLALALAISTAGCASSSGVFQIGPDTYQITTTAITSFGGAGAARASAIATANDYCAKQGKNALVVGTEVDSQFTQ